MTINVKQQRILITRNEPKASAFAEKIEQAGGIPYVTPLIEIVSTFNQSHQSVLQNVQQYEWLFFTSANGVAFFLEKLDSLNFIHQLKNCRIAAVGSKTNQALQEWGLEADFIPAQFDAETMANEFLNQYQPQGHVLLVQGQRSRTVLNETFKKQGIPFHSIQIYTTVVHQAIQEELQETLLSENIDYITFASPSTVEAFMELVDDTSPYLASKVVCIGTTTEKRARKAGFYNTIIPDTFTVEGMLEAIQQDMLSKE